MVFVLRVSAVEWRDQVWHLQTFSEVRECKKLSKLNLLFASDCQQVFEQPVTLHKIDQ